jgi:hypothetical protein
LAASLKNAVVREIDRKTAETIILKYEWLGTMGTTDFQFGLYCGEHLAAVECFGRTAGTRTPESICGKEYAHLVKTLTRGATVHWAHPHAGSFAISHACRLMAQKGYHICVAYGDPAANEIGSVYQGCGFNYCGTTESKSSNFVWSGKPVAKDPLWGTLKNGKEHDERKISQAISRGYRIECSRRERRLEMIQEGFVFLKSPPKHRYVGFYGDEETVTTLKAALKWETFPYPKRDR